MSKAALIARAAAGTNTARANVKKCAPLVAKRDALNLRIAAIQKQNDEARKRALAKIEAQAKKDADKLNAFKKKALEKLEAQFGKVCTSKPRRPRKDKGAKKGARQKAANDAPADTKPAKKASKKVAKKASKKVAKKATKRGSKAKPEPEPTRWEQRALL